MTRGDLYHKEASREAACCPPVHSRATHDCPAHSDNAPPIKVCAYWCHPAKLRLALQYVLTACECSRLMFHQSAVNAIRPDAIIYQHLNRRCTSQHACCLHIKTALNMGWCCGFLDVTLARRECTKRMHSHNRTRCMLAGYGQGSPQMT